MWEQDGVRGQVSGGHWGLSPHLVIEGSQWPEHHKSSVGNAVAPILQIRKPRPQKKESQGLERKRYLNLSQSVSRSSVLFTPAALLEEGELLSAWGAEKGLQVMVRN